MPSLGFLESSKEKEQVDAADVVVEEEVADGLNIVDMPAADFDSIRVELVHYLRLLDDFVVEPECSMQADRTAQTHKLVEVVVHMPSIVAAVVVLFDVAGLIAARTIDHKFALIP